MIHDPDSVQCGRCFDVQQHPRFRLKGVVPRPPETPAQTARDSSLSSALTFSVPPASSSFEDVATFRSSARPLYGMSQPRFLLRGQVWGKRSRSERCRLDGEHFGARPAGRSRGRRSPGWGGLGGGVQTSPLQRCSRGPGFLSTPSPPHKFVPKS